jgi:arabinogalactan oligomer/maltooligosaccharide transport system permease protein
MTRQNRATSILFHLILIVTIILVLFPVYFIIQASIRPGQALYSTGLNLLPQNPTLDNYRYMLFERPFPLWLRNSLVVALFTTMFTLIVATSAAYAFSRWKFVGRNAWLMIFLALQAFPAVLTLVPIFQILATVSQRTPLNLLNLSGLVLAYTSGALVFTIWNMKGFFDTIPYDMEEAALIDGCSPTQAFLRVILPISTPGLAITALFGFMAGWSEFAMANVILQKETLYTLPVGLFGLQDNYRVPWGWFAAGSIMAAIPVMIMFFIAQRYLVGGLTAGGVKG